MAKSSFVGMDPLLSNPSSLYKTFFSFYSFRSCSSPLFSFWSLYKKFFPEKYHLAPVPMAAPWLVLNDDNGLSMTEEVLGITEQVYYNLCERPYSKIYKRNIPEMSWWFRYYQSPSNKGWLLVYCNIKRYPELWGLKFGDCFLWNPVSLKKIWLPSIQDWITNNLEEEVEVEAGLLSAPPTVDNDSMVFFLLNIYVKDYREKQTILFCHPGDEQWRSQDIVPLNEHIQSITCFEGKLHALCSKNMHRVIEKQLGSDSEMHLSITNFPVEQDRFDEQPNRKIHLLESRDELFSVVVDYHLQSGRYEDITNFEVFRMNFSLMVWEKVESLGDHVLFLGKGTKASCSAADLGLTRGHVYFLQEDATVYVFDLEDGTISVDVAFSHSRKRFYDAEWVTMPTSIGVKGNETVDLEAKPNIKTSVKVIEEGNKNNEESEIPKSGTWSNFYMDILELIASHLHTADYVHYRAVSKTHRSVASVPRKRTTLESSHTTSLSPWLILHQNNQECVYRFINPMHYSETYLINLSEYLLDATIHCSKGGWLLMSKSCNKNLFFFFNPFTRDMIKLPELPDGYDENEFEGISFSSVPTSSDCTVFGISGDYSDVLITTISRGVDYWVCGRSPNKKLSPEEEKFRSNPCRSNPIFYEGCFYCLNMRGSLGVFHAHSENNWWRILKKLVPPCTSYHQSFLVECEGQILSVFVTSLKSRPVQIFKLHTCENTNMQVWVEVTDLGEYMLFVSHTSCTSAIAPVSRMKNKVYFPSLDNERIVFYSLDTCRFETLFRTGSSDEYSSSNFYRTKKHLYCTWIEPNWSSATAEELVW